VAKANPELRDALHEALDRLMRSGTYQELLTRWGLTTGALPSSSVNGGGGAAAAD
jgi:polar amino acid transport system substrate-binding protein